MAFNVGIQASLELTKLFPIRDAAQAAGTKLLSIARDLRKSGSDIVVEVDLAEYLGRLRLNPEFEASFRANVTKQETLRIPHVEEIVLA